VTAYAPLSSPQTMSSMKKTVPNLLQVIHQHRLCGLAPGILHVDIAPVMRCTIIHECPVPVPVPNCQVLCALIH